MRTIPHRELRNHSSEILKAVENGETIEVTNYGKVVAILIPPITDPYDKLVATGKIRKGHKVKFTEVKSTAFTDKTVEQLLAEDRRR